MVPLFKRWVFVGICVMAGVLLTLNLNKTASLSNVDSRVLKTGHDAVRLWFFALECDKPHDEFLAKQAVLSAKHYTDLVPILMLHCRNEKLEGWMDQHGVIITDPGNHKLIRMLDANPEKLASLKPLSWHRFAIPTVLDDLLTSKHKLLTKLAEQNPSLLEYALFTDADVVFTNNLVFHRSMLPRFFALPIQGDAWCCGDNPYIKQVHSNAGVMLMNVTSFREIEDEFSEYVLKHLTSNQNEVNFDEQAAFHNFFPVRMRHVTWSQWFHLAMHYTTYFKLMYTKYYSDTLPKEYSWEPYLGANPQAVILHWHGPSVNIDDCSQLKTAIVTAPVKGNHRNNKLSTTSFTNKAVITAPSTPTGVVSTATKSVFADPNQLVLQQLLLHERTTPYVLYESKSSFYSLPTTLHLRTAYTTPNTPSTHASTNTQYPPIYDWYTPMQLSPEEKASVLSTLYPDESGLLALTPNSLDGYQYASGLYFSYMNIICSR